MINADDIRRALAALRYHNRLKSEQDPGYKDSSLESDALQAISDLSDLLKRMTESDRADFIGWEI